MINAVDNLGLVELPSQGLKYSWSNGRGASKEIKAKLDRGIANSDWWNLFPNADMKVLPQVSSDHSPVVLNSEGYLSFARRPFRFEAIWTRDRRSHWIVEHAWAKAECQANRDDVVSWEREKDLKCQIDKLLRREELLWFQKAKIQWRLEGDRCSRFFFMTTIIQDNAELLRIPSWEEVRNVVLSMGAFKAPGPDGMVSWLFIKEVLLAYGFDTRWVGWVSECISSATMKLLINGAYFRDIKPKRGLRQGDPLSPYLFILCTEILSRLFLRKVESGLIHGFKLSRGGPSLHHLMFADDIFVFGKACITEASHIKETLDTFCSWSGLSFNSSKSSIFFSGNTRGAIANQLTDFLGFEHIPMDSCYLGLPMFRTSKKNDFNFLVECLDTKLAGWKSRLLSKASRLTLIKSVALAMPIYAMHTARIPKAICAKLDARIRRFWWGAKEENARPLCLKAWDDLCVPKAYGGLGLRRMSSMNEAIIAIWGWDLLTGKNSQCLLFLQGKYLRAGSFKYVEALPTDSTFWKAIIESRDTLLRGACF
ncbi:hypothetical protein UlMin_029094 [Ulmus minor]